MSGRTDQDGLAPEPLAAKRYATEEAELTVLVDGWTAQVVRYREATGLIMNSAGNPDLRDWLDATLYRHREQAYAEGVLATQRSAPSWWDRNWFVIVLLGLIVVARVTIGLVNGWS